MTLTEVMQQAQRLNPQERKELVKLLVDSLEVGPGGPPRRLSELRGLGKDIWKDVDAQDYVDHLRNEWDKPR